MYDDVYIERLCFELNKIGFSKNKIHEIVSKVFKKHIGKFKSNDSDSGSGNNFNLLYDGQVKKPKKSDVDIASDILSDGRLNLFSHSQQKTSHEVPKSVKTNKHNFDIASDILGDSIVSNNILDEHVVDSIPNNMLGEHVVGGSLAQKPKLVMPAGYENFNIKQFEVPIEEQIKMAKNIF